MSDRAQPPPPQNTGNEPPAQPRQPNRPGRYNPTAPRPGQARGQQGMAPPNQGPGMAEESYLERIIRLLSEALELRRNQLANGIGPANRGEEDAAVFVVRMARARLIRELMADLPQGNNQELPQIERAAESQDNKENNFLGAPP